MNRITCPKTVTFLWRGQHIYALTKEVETRVWVIMQQINIVLRRSRWFRGSHCTYSHELLNWCAGTFLEAMSFQVVDNTLMQKHCFVLREAKFLSNMLRDSFSHCRSCALRHAREPIMNYAVAMYVQASLATPLADNRVAMHKQAVATPTN